jgi:two-component system alkaline phosphatase synthesis response regulator PhoP
MQKLVVLCGNAERKASFLAALTKAGYLRAFSASSMAEAARILRDAVAACVIVDAELEDIPGLKAIPILRGLCEQAKIIFTAPRNTRRLEARVRSLEVFYYYISSAQRSELVAAVKEAVGEPAPGRAGHPPKVLIVDDDPDFHVTVHAFLQSDGYSLLSAFSEQEGLEMARREKPDLILLDVIMQTTTDGFDFCREARRDPAIKHTPILGISAMEKLTGAHFPPDIDRDLFPVDAYMNKPVSPEGLLAEVKKLLAMEA